MRISAQRPRTSLFLAVGITFGKQAELVGQSPQNDQPHLATANAGRHTGTDSDRPFALGRGTGRYPQRGETLIAMQSIEC